MSLVGSLPSLAGPIDTPEGLRQAIETLIRLAEVLGIDPAWTARLRQILDDPRVFDIVLAIARYLTGLIASDASHATVDLQPTLDAQSFIDWLPIVVQIIALLRELRRDQPLAA